MDFEIYCDESRQDLFNRPIPGDNYVLIGGIWIRSEDRHKHKLAIKEIRRKHGLHSEFKWNKLGPSRLPFFKDIITFFFDAPDIRFRTVVLKADELDAVRFAQADNELMFYKFYYQLLHHWILDKNKYHIFLDTKTNRVHNRIKVLNKCLSNSNLLSEISIQALPSNELDLIQLADVLIGAASYKFHHREGSIAKLAIIELIEEKLNREIRPTPRHEQKFNIFRFKPGGGW